MKNMFCNRVIYALLVIFISVNYWKYQFKRFYHREACLYLCHIWETVERVFSLLGNILDVQVFYLVNLVSQMGNKRFPK